MTSVNRFHLLGSLLLSLPFTGQALAQTSDGFDFLRANVSRTADLALEHIDDTAQLSRVTNPTDDQKEELLTVREQVAEAARFSKLPASLLLAQMYVESAGNPRALSAKGALGLWQLMPETARRFGLTVSSETDHRLDPALSTQAALQYMTELYRRFGDWELALAAYNAGEGAVENAIQKGRSRSFARLSVLRLLPLETRAYVPAVLARAGILWRKGE